MADIYNPGPNPTEERPADESRQSGFHYYSGGEIKELEHTRVSPLLWGFWTVVIIGAIGYLFLSGALGPHGPFGGFKPFSSSGSKLASIQQTLNQQANGGATAQQADMAQLVPIIQASEPGVTDHETLDMAIANGSNIYQNYCIGCHGPNQDGNGVNASSLNPKPRNLHDGPFMRETLNYQRINTSLHYGVHGTAMPRWENTLTPREIQEVISYVLSLTWTMPNSGTDTTTAQLATPAGMTSPDASAGLSGPGKSPSGSTTGTAGGSSVQGGDRGGAGSVSNSPVPITPMINGDPTAATSTAPPSQSGQSAAVAPGSLNANTPTDTTGGPKAPAAHGPDAQHPRRRGAGAVGPLPGVL